MGLPVTVLGKLGDSVLFGGMSMLQDELDRLRNTVLKASYALSTLVIPLTALLVLRAENFTVLILGPLYVEATPIVEVYLCVALRSFIKIGDASMRATDSLISGTLIKLGFLIAVSAGVGIQRFSYRCCRCCGVCHSSPNPSSSPLDGC